MFSRLRYWVIGVFCILILTIGTVYLSGYGSGSVMAPQFFCRVDTATDTTVVFPNSMSTIDLYNPSSSNPALIRLASATFNRTFPYNGAVASGYGDRYFICPASGGLHFENVQIDTCEVIVKATGDDLYVLGKQ